MSPFTFVDVALTPGLSLLPSHMDTPQARAMILACCLQESDLTHRRQMGHGPAKSYAQFEVIGVAGVLLHPRTKAHAERVCAQLDIEPRAAAIHEAMEWNDALTVAFARLLLWTHPKALPKDAHGYELGWTIYRESWRPGKPKPERWGGSFGVAWSVIADH